MATTWYVDDNCSPPTDGTSGDPDCTIQEGIYRAVNGDTVLVRAGTYEWIDFDGRNITVKRETTAILPKITTTTSTTKVTFAQSENGAVLDGFEITGSTSRGILCDGASPTIKNCTIWGNQAPVGDDDNGGGIRLTNSNAKILDCIIGPSNQANGIGGGIYIAGGGTPQITGCTIKDNTASGTSSDNGNGGGIGVKDSFPVITNCVISGNTANGRLGGGGVFVSPPTGSAEGGTAGGPVTMLTNCLVVENSAVNATGRGGGLFLGSVTFPGYAGIYNCTLSRNTATGDGDGIFALGTGVALFNSIVWDNGTGFGSEITLSDATITLDHDDIEGGLSNIKKIGNSFAEQITDGSCNSFGNLDSDPNFCADYHLCRPSPCIDAGSNPAVPADVADLDGDNNTMEATPLDLDDDPRFVDDLCTADTGCDTPPIVDMGAYEFASESAIPGDIVWDSDPLSLNQTTRSLKFSVQAPAGGTAAAQAAIKLTMIDLQHPVPANVAASVTSNYTTFDTRINGACVGGSHDGHHCDVSADCRVCTAGNAARLNRVCTSGADCSVLGVPPVSEANCPAGGTCTSLAGCTAADEAIPADASGQGGCARWVGEPHTFRESQNLPLLGTYRATRLQCTPFYYNWSAEGLIHVTGAEIMPSSTYDVQVFLASAPCA